MIPVQQQYRLTERGGAWVLETNPLRRLVYGAVSLFLGAAAAVVVGGGADLVSPGSWGPALWALMLGSSLWIALRRRRWEFSQPDSANRMGHLILRTGFAGIEVQKQELSLGSEAEIQLLRIMLGKKEKGRSISKLMLETGERHLFIDESTQAEGIGQLARALSLATGLPLREKVE